jgi:hypothetical protein
VAAQEVKRVVGYCVIDRRRRLRLVQQPQFVKRLELLALVVVCAHGFKPHSELKLGDVGGVLRWWASVLTGELKNLFVGSNEAIFRRRRWRLH